MANSAPTPDGYVSAFQNLGASLQASNYMGLYTLTSFDTLTCASQCDQASGCSAFNVYLERDPTLNASAVSCPNPPSTTNYKCTLWGAPVSSAEATNSGQYQDSFQVVIAGSNGWSSLDSMSMHPSKCYRQVTIKTLHHLPSAATLVPRNSAERLMLPPTLAATWATNTSHSAKVKATTPRRAPMPAMLKRLMIASIQQMTAASCHASVFQSPPHLPASYTDLPQVFFNAYVLSENAIPQGLYCSMYNETWDPSYGTNYGQYRGSDRYTVSESYSYTLSS